MKDSLVDFSSILTALQFFTIQTVPTTVKNSKEKITFNQFINNILPSFGFLFLFLIVNLIYIASLFAIMTFCKSINFKFSKLFGNIRTNHSLVKMITFSYLLFLFLMNQFFCNNLNTRKVVINTDYFVSPFLPELRIKNLNFLIFHNFIKLTSTDKLLKTDKEPCFYEDSAELNYFALAPKGTLANQIYEMRNKDVICSILKDGDMGSVKDKKHDNLFIVSHNFGEKLLLKAVQLLSEKNTFSSKFF